MLEVFPVLGLFGGEIAIALAISAAIASSVMAAQAAQQQAKSQQEMAEYNAKLQEAEGKARQEAAQTEEQRLAGQQNRFLGAQKAKFAKSGFSIEEGSSVDVMANTWGEFATDRALTLRNGLLEKMQLDSSANLSRMEGDAAMQRGRNQATASYLSGFGNAAYMYGNSGGFGLGKLNMNMNSGLRNSAKYNQGISGQSGLA